MTKEINLLGALHPARRGLELGLFNRVVPPQSLADETRRLVELLLMKNQQGVRQLKYMINKNVEADLQTAQGFEAMGAALTGALLGSWQVPDADGQHGWADYRTQAEDSKIHQRRAAALNFWTD